MEKFGAARIIKCQRAQRIGHAEAAHIGAVVGFDAHNRHDDFCGHTVAFRHRVDHAFILGIKTPAGAHAGAAGIGLAEFIPRARGAGAVHDIDDIAFVFHAAEKVFQLVACELAALHFIINKALNIGIAVEAADGHRFGGSVKHGAFAADRRQQGFRCFGGLLLAAAGGQGQRQQPYGEFFHIVTSGFH